MIVDRESAGLFIAQYTRVLRTVHELTGAKLSADPIKVLAAARKSLEERPALLEDANV